MIYKLFENPFNEGLLKFSLRIHSIKDDALQAHWESIQ